MNDQSCPSSTKGNVGLANKDGIGLCGRFASNTVGDLEISVAARRVVSMLLVSVAKNAHSRSSNARDFSATGAE